MNELDVVKLINGVNDLPAGAIGTIVHVYEGADAYEVEFEFQSKGFDVPNKVTTVHRIDLEVVSTKPRR